MMKFDTLDTMTGEKLHFEFDLSADRVVINGVEVELAPEMVADEGNPTFRFKRRSKEDPATRKLFTISPEDERTMLEIWRSKGT